MSDASASAPAKSSFAATILNVYCDNLSITYEMGHKDKVKDLRNENEQLKRQLEELKKE